MGFLDSLKDSVSSMVGGGKKEQGNGVQHEVPPDAKKKPAKKGLLAGFFGGSSDNKTPAKSQNRKSMTPKNDDDSLSMFDSDSDDNFDYDSIDDEIKGHRSDVLDLLNIAEDYPVPSNVLLVGDLDRVRFDITQPQGYDMKMVEEFWDSVHDSISWYVDKLQQRNNDIRKMEDMLNKQNTDIHNAKVAEAMSDPDFTVMTGTESTAEQELQEAQVRIMNLEDENRKLQKKLQAVGNGGGDQMDAETQSRYDALQNQLGIVQRENQKLRAQLKRQALEEATSLDRQQSEYTTADEYGDDDYSRTGQFDEDGGSENGPAMPTPGAPMSMPTPNGNAMSMPMPDSAPHGSSVAMSAPSAPMPTPGVSMSMPTPGAGVAPMVNPFNGAGNDSKSMNLKEMVNPPMSGGRVGENTSKQMTMKSALDADDDYDLDPQVTSANNGGSFMNSTDDQGDDDYDGDFNDSFSFDYDGREDSSNPESHDEPAPIPTSIDDGDYDEIDLLGDDDEDEDSVISLDDGLFD